MDDTYANVLFKQVVRHKFMGQQSPLLVIIMFSVKLFQCNSVREIYASITDKNNSVTFML